MQIQCGIVMDALETIKVEKDSSLAILRSAAKHNWNLFYMQPKDLYQKENEVFGSMCSLSVTETDNTYSVGISEEKSLASLDVVLMRKDPPFNMNYIYSTYLLERAQNSGVLVVNNPQSLRNYNEKYFATEFPDLIPDYLISSQKNLLRDFASKHEFIILKPLDGMGGASIFKTSYQDINFSVITETLTNHGQNLVIAQKFIPEIVAGDKRIIIINGEPIPIALARIPLKNESRGSLSVGAKPVIQPLTERDALIAGRVGKVLRDKGILFAGIDVIGDWLTEVNITSPTGIIEVQASYDIDIGSLLIKAIENRLHEK